MQSIAKIIEAKFRDAFNKLEISQSAQILLVEATKPEFGDYQVNGAMAIAKALKLNPRDLAQKIIDNVEVGSIVSKMEIAGPGFINLTIDNGYLSNYITQLTPQNNFGVCLNIIEQPRTIVIDYSSPNLAKEMHVGHLRSTVIGDALASVHEYLGNKVIRQNHVGDWGTQFGMLIAHMEELLSDGETTHTISDLEEFYRNSKIRFDASPEFANKAREYVVILQNWQNEGDVGKKVFNYWQKFKTASISHCNAIYQKLQISLKDSNLAPESMYNDKLVGVIKTLEDKKLLSESNGAKCIFFADGEITSGETTPYIVQKQDGGYLYATTDLAAMDYRVHTLKSDRILLVVDARQAFHFKQLFIVSKKAGFADVQTQLEHVPFGTMMNEDGKPFKTRDGGTVKLIELIDEAITRAGKIVLDRNPDWDEKSRNELANMLAIGAIKYADLSKNRTSDYIFSFDKMLAFDGNTAPYLLYAYTRIQSILKKAIQEDITGNSTQLHIEQLQIVITESAEHKLALHIVRFADMMLLTAKESNPHFLCLYLYNLAGLFMQFYESCSILKADSIEARNSRLRLALQTAEVLHTGLKMLGINTVDRM